MYILTLFRSMLVKLILIRLDVSVIYLTIKCSDICFIILRVGSI